MLKVCRRIVDSRTWTRIGAVLIRRWEVRFESPGKPARGI